MGTESLYSMIKAPDIAGGIEQGMKMRDMIDQRGRQAKLDQQNDQKFQMEKQNRTFDLISRVAPGIKDQESYTKALGFLGSQGVDLNGIPESYDPELVNSYVNMAMSHKEKMDQAMQKERFGYEKNKDAQSMELRRREIEAAEKAAGMKAYKEANELNATQAKALGNYEIGAKAEQQFQNAVANKDEYDPTAPGQWIDNSDWAPAWMKNSKANESQAAQSGWVETFLREASGAAIPPSERGAYAKDYFPQPGDSPQVVANKEALRKQKMQNSLIGAGPNGQRMAQPPLATTSPAQKKSFKTTEIEWAD